MSLESRLEDLTLARNSIRNKMVSAGQATRTDKLATLASNLVISSGTDTSDATVDSASQILSGYSAYSNGTKYTGSMTNNGAVSPTALNAGGSYTIPEGYHNGSGVVSTNTLASQTSGTAAAADIVSGKTAWVNGTQVTGSMSIATETEAREVAINGNMDDYDPEEEILDTEY